MVFNGALFVLTAEDLESPARVGGGDKPTGTPVRDYFASGPGCEGWC